MSSRCHALSILGDIVFALVLLTLPAQARSDFYRASPSEIAGNPGTVIRTESMNGAPLGARTFRVLYRSTGLKGEPIAVSGVVITPDGSPPPGGWPLIAWAHPTTGIVEHCAPSLALFFFQQIPGLRMMLEHGFAITATDYPGLGTPGPHPYLVGESEGRAVLDSIRAAHALPDAHIGQRAVLWGHSQGGQAVLYAASLAKSYSPELAVLGVVGAAPATNLGALMRADIATAGGKNLLAMTLWSWEKVFGAPMQKIVASEAVPEIDKLANICLESIIDIRPRRLIAQSLLHKFLTVDDPTKIEPWQEILAKSTIGTLPNDIPVLIAQGTADDVVDPPITASYVKSLCQAGSRVQYLLFDGVGHGMISRDAAKSSVAWMAARFKGTVAPDDCANANLDRLPRR